MLKRSRKKVCIVPAFGPEIRVNAILPGAIVTAMLDSVGGEASMEGMKRSSPLKRVGQSSEIAATALFFATDNSSFIAGQRCALTAALAVDCRRSE